VEKVKPKILIIENSIDVTGALKSITRTAFDLKDFFDFQFIIPTQSRGKFWIEGKRFDTIYELPMKEVSYRFSSLILYIPFLIINTIRLSRIIRKNRIDLIHVNDLYNLLPVVYKMFGGAAPYVCHIRFLPDRFPKFLFNFWLRLHFHYSKRIIAVSQAVMHQLPIHSKIVVIHNELPVEERFPELNEQNQEKEAFTFLYLSNYISGKGQNFALLAFAKICNALPNWKLRFVGGNMGLKKNGYYKLELQRQARDLGISEKIEWIGFTEEVEREYKSADIILNFSESESFSITCLEALFYGRPIIATDCGGPSEIIEQNKTGLLVENRNIDAMAKALLLLAKNDSLRIKMGIEGRQSVREKFSIQNTSYKIRKEYRAILNHL
jgi:glycosyltransferase involved in cell wall biosynthesis